MTKSVSIVIVEDEAILRDLIQEAIHLYPNWHIAGAFSDGLQGCEHCLQNPPDLAILDLKLPGLSGLEIFKRMRQKRLKTKTLIFSGAIRQEQIQEALKRNIEGIAEKNISLNELITGIETIIGGNDYYSSGVLKMIQELAQNPIRETPFQKLSTTERSVLQLIAEGFSSKEIAEKLRITAKTVDNHRNSLMKKLGIKGVAGLTRYAIQQGLINT